MVQFFLPVSTGRVTAVGTITKPGRNLLFADAVVNDEEGNEVARGRGSFTRSAMPFDGIALYR
jgi:acyl-coenzyme A thioesterase PaaI-like protein